MGRSNATTTHMLDTAALVDALDCERMARGMTQAAVAREIGCSPNIWQHLPRGRQVDAHTLVSILAWLDGGVVITDAGDVANYTIERPSGEQEAAA